jgi:replicative DNA helicase
MKNDLTNEWRDDLIPPLPNDVPILSSQEQGALALMVQDPDILAKQRWDASYFAIEAHRIVFEAIQTVHSRAGLADDFMVIAELERQGLLDKANGRNAVHEIFTSLYLPSGKVCQDVADDYRTALRRAKCYRDLIKLWTEQEQDIRRGRGDIEQLSLTITAINSDDGKPKRTKKEMLNQIIDEMEGKAEKECFSTGLVMLDRYLGGGLHRGEMMTVAAETGGGKSILLAQAAATNLQEDKSVVFFSLEMSGEDIYRRLAANIAGVPVRDMEEYKHNYGRELPIITQAIASLMKMPIEVVDNLHNIADIEREIARAAGENRADLVAVDYLQIINMPSMDNRENAISEAARRLKTCAMKHKCAMITASQVNDEGKLRESRAIGMHSDQVVQIEHGKEKSRVVVKKNRRGARNVYVDVEMQGEISKFREI